MSLTSSNKKLETTAKRNRSVGYIVAASQLNIIH